MSIISYVHRICRIYTCIYQSVFFASVGIEIYQLKVSSVLLDIVAQVGNDKNK